MGSDTINRGTTHMSAKKKAVVEQQGELELNDEAVREYLKNHDDFLQRHPDMLDYLHISHGSGSAVSLVGVGSLAPCPWS